MPRAPNDKIKEAFKLYKKGLKLNKIAEKLGLPYGTVRRWKSTHNWDNERSDKDSNSDANVRSEKGAPRGNKNATGNKGGKGGPQRNIYAEKHGAYSKIYFDMLDDDERELMESVELDEEQIILLQLRDLIVKARDLKRRIKEAKEERGGLALDGVVRERTPTGEKTTTITTSTFDRIIKLEAELDKTQGRITKATDLLVKYREGQERLGIEQEKLNLSKQELERRKKFDERVNW